MKTTRFFGTLFFLIVLLSCSQKSDNNETKTQINPENIVLADFEVEGMVCAVGCAKTIEEEIAALKGVSKSTVDYDSGKAHFEFDKTQISELEIITKIEGIANGQYKVKRISSNSINENASQSGNTTSSESEKVKVDFKGFEVPNLFTFLINQV